MIPCKPILACLAGLFFSAFVQCAEYRSVAVTKAIGYDAPSSEATKVLIYSKDYPLEVIVTLGDWLKLRDQQGGLVWLENKNLSQKRFVFVLERTDINLADTVSTALVAMVEKGVSLELVSANLKNGMVKVKHRDGLSGYVQAGKLWGIN